MKLRSITLTNVRRFAGTTVTLDGLGDGLNVVAAPNEAGKSTFFEALEALVFVPHRSTAAEARSLRPYAGGAPEVAAEIELAGARFRVSKRWLNRPFARIAELPSGRIIAQDDEAEGWIATRLAGGGLPELLWVRQGSLALEPEGRTPAEKAEQDRLARIRRDLLSSVASELDAVTGGRRLDAIAARCAADLAKLATSTGRPKKDGPWGAALRATETLRAELARLDGLCAAYAADLAERSDLRAALACAEDPAAARTRSDAIAAAEAAATAASDADLRAARAASARLDRARARMEAGAVTLAMDYLPGVALRVRVDGRPLDPGASLACTGPAILDLPGLGRLTLAPGGDAARAATDAAEAEAALRAALAPSGAADVAALAALADRRVAAEARAARATAELAGLAPDGRPALAAEHARLSEAAAEADPAAPDPAAAGAAEADAHTALAAAEAALATAREARLAAALAETTARERHAAVGRTLAIAATAAAALPDRADLAARQDGTRATADAAERAELALRATLPDVAAAEAALAQAKDADRAAEAERHRLATRDAELVVLIAARAEEAVEERRDEAAGLLDTAEARAASYAAEAAALTRLRDALAAARAAARERYLAPVAAELAPLLARVLDGAELRLDPTRLLPESLGRNSLDEDLDCLSGGTREQIAILTRLAFARLLARTGRATPVILDDALVYADDSRFSRVLAALGAAASDAGVQVIFLTCRERAFADLDACRPALRLAGPETAMVQDGY